jgi:DNA-binding SARP family transcriptional activator
MGEMEFCLLGTLIVRQDGAIVSVQQGKQRALLAALLLKAGQVVPMDELAETLWSAAPPPSAAVTVRNYVKRLRHALREQGQDRIRAQRPGYLIAAEPDELDVTRFETLIGTAQEAARARSWNIAAEHAQAALSLWRGQPLADVYSDVLVLREVPRLEELRLRAAETLSDAGLHLGRHREVIADLERLAAANPLRERLHALHMLALYRDGRQAEALRIYQRAHQLLIDELGSEPGIELRRLHQQILAADPVLTAPGPARGASALASGDLPDESGGAGTPGTAEDEPGHGRKAPLAQLPADVPDFTGRERYVRRLIDLLAGTGDGLRPGAVRMVALTGPGGVGKTALAVHGAHAVASLFPDGQIYLNLGASTPHPVTAADALARLMRDLGVPPADVPADESERAAHYRSRAAGRQLLIVLDDARDARQVLPLLPGTASVAVLVTSRSWLAGLPGQLLAVDSLSHAEAWELLGSICGAHRVTADPAASALVLNACAGLPLAVRIAGSRLASRPGWSIRAVANRLADEIHRLEELQIGDLAVRATFQVSYAALPSATSPADNTARAFRLLGLWPGPDISLEAAASLLGLNTEAAACLMESLVDIHLLQSITDRRYRFHDLIRVFASERANQDEAPSSRDQAIRRVLAWYLHTADAARIRLSRGQTERELQLFPAHPWAVPLDFADVEAAADWSDIERSNTVAAVDLAYSRDMDAICAQLASVTWPNFLRRPWDGWISVLQTGIDSATRSGDTGARAWLLTYLGAGRIVKGACAEAIGCLQTAIPLSRDARDLLCEATAILNLAIALKDLRRFDEAIGQFEKTLALHRALGSKHVGSVLMNMGMLLVEAGRPEEGAGRMEEALLALNQAGNRALESLAHSQLAGAYRQLGRAGEAIQWARSALEISQRVRDPYQETAGLQELGLAMAAAGDKDQARSFLASAYDLANGLGIPEAAQISAALAALNAEGAEPAFRQQ